MSNVFIGIFVGVGIVLFLAIGFVVDACCDKDVDVD